MSSKNPQSDYDQALALKDGGNTAFKAGDFKLALKNYSRIFMHIGMNPCMNMSQMMGQGGGGPSPGPGGAGGAPNLPQQSAKDPLQQKTDELRLTAFNNMAAVYAKMGKWDDCKDKCTRVLKHDDKNTKALFRRGMAHRRLNLYELARVDLEKAKQILAGKGDAAIERELKLLAKDEKNADKEFYAAMKKRMQKAQKKKKAKKAEAESKKAALAAAEALKDDNPNIQANAADDEFVWDVPQNGPSADTSGVSGTEEQVKSDADAKVSEKQSNKTEQPSEF